MNCFDMAAPSSRCLPVTSLQVHQSHRSRFDPLLNEPDETHEIAFQHSRGAGEYGHFTRVTPNVFRPESQSEADHRAGAYTQFVQPGLPPLFYGQAGFHRNTLELNVTQNAHVQLVWNHDTRTAHPIHLHGFKFVVVAVGEADGRSDRCSVVACPHKEDWFDWPASKQRVQDTISKGRYVVKDTVVLPAGGYLVIRFIADNPGVWLAHCHTDFHYADGMGLLMRVSNESHEMPPNFPSCDRTDRQAYDAVHRHSITAPSCSCLHNPESIMQASPESDWLCSTQTLCRHTAAPKDIMTNARGVEKQAEARGSSSRIWCSLAALVLSAGVLAFQWKPPTLQWLPTKVSVICLEEMQRRLSSSGLFVVVGIASAVGIVYLDVGTDTSERAFRERIALIFWQSAYWAISTLYAAITEEPSRHWKVYDPQRANGGWEVTYQLPKLVSDQITQSRSRLMVLCTDWPDQTGIDHDAEGTNTENIKIQLSSVPSHHATRFVVGISMAWCYPAIFTCVMASFTAVTLDVPKLILTTAVLMLVQQVFESLGYFLAAGCTPHRAAVIGSIVSQFSVVVGGFYRTLPDWAAWLSHAAPVQHSFSALIKLQFDYKDSFWCTPQRAAAWRGYGWCPLEFSGLVQDMKVRGISVISSEVPVSVIVEFVILLGMVLLLRVMTCMLMLSPCATDRRKEACREDYKEDHNSRCHDAVLISLSSLEGKTGQKDYTSHPLSNLTAIQVGIEVSTHDVSLGESDREANIVNYAHCTNMVSSDAEADALVVERTHSNLDGDEVVQRTHSNLDEDEIIEWDPSNLAFKQSDSSLSSPNRQVAVLSHEGNDAHCDRPWVSTEIFGSEHMAQLDSCPQDVTSGESDTLLGELGGQAHDFGHPNWTETLWEECVKTTRICGNSKKELRVRKHQRLAVCSDHFFGCPRAQLPKSLEEYF